MNLRIALAGNPNSGKTTLFNALTGSSQSVGNWPGVTVEKKEGRLKKHDGVIITDLPGIYSLSPYTLEEVVARGYLLSERPNAIINLVDGTNLERNLYLTTQLTELGIPVVVAINMMDAVRKSGDTIDSVKLAKQLGCSVIEISALKNEGVMQAAEAAISAAENGSAPPLHRFSRPVELALSRIEAALPQEVDPAKKRWYAIKIFERDKRVIEQFKSAVSLIEAAEKIISVAEKELDDEAESIITGERYAYVNSIAASCSKRRSAGRLTRSDKIDKIVTNRWLALPIFAIIMFLVYYISMVGIGSAATTWMNDGVFGDGWHLLGIGSKEYAAAVKSYGDSDPIIKAFAVDYGNADIVSALDGESESYSPEAAEQALAELIRLTPANAKATYELKDEETLKITRIPGATRAMLQEAAAQYLNTEYKSAYGAPDASTYGKWVPGLPKLAESGLGSIGAAGWLTGLISSGIIAGVGAVLGFVPQLLVLFLLLALLEASGYMARIAFVLDRIFRKFGLSGKSFIPMLIGVGCGVPGIMASRTIENERDRRMTIITTTFIPCSAKIPFISMIAGALFGGSALISTSAYFLGMGAIVVSGIMLKKTRRFSGDPAPFVMELPAYRLPTAGNLLRSMWERGWAFIKKAGTIILLSSVVVWFLSFFGFTETGFRMLSEDQLDLSILASVGRSVAWIFAPLGFGNWQSTVASITGLIAKENIVGTMGILYGSYGNVYSTLAAVFTSVSGFSFLVFNLLCAPCFAAIGAIRREMNSPKWTWFAILYQCGFAYTVALLVNQFGRLLAGRPQIPGLIAAFVLFAGMVYMLLRREKPITYAKPVIETKYSNQEV